MRSLRGLVLAMVIVAASATVAGATSRGEKAEGFIRSLAEAALGLVTDKDVKGEARREKFQALLHANFDVPWIGQFVLGRYWRLATPEQREAYLKLFSDVIVFTYVRRFDDYESQQLQVLGHRDDGKDFILVDSRIHKPGTSAGAVGVVWRVLPVGDGQRIVDVVIEGVSMSITQRNEYASVIQRNGGSVQSLIDALKENVDRLRQQG